MGKLSHQRLTCPVLSRANEELIPIHLLLQPPTHPALHWRNEDSNPLPQFGFRKRTFSLDGVRILLFLLFFSLFVLSYGGRW